MSEKKNWLIKLGIGVIIALGIIIALELIFAMSGAHMDIPQRGLLYAFFGALMISLYYGLSLLVEARRKAGRDIRNGKQQW